MSAAHGQGKTDERSADQEQRTRFGHWSSRQRFAAGNVCLDRNGDLYRNARGRNLECSSEGRRWLQLGEARTKKRANNETVGDEVHGRPQMMRSRGVGGSEPRGRDERPAGYPPTLFPQASG